MEEEGVKAIYEEVPVEKPKRRRKRIPRGGIPVSILVSQELAKADNPRDRANPQRVLQWLRGNSAPRTEVQRLAMEIFRREIVARYKRPSFVVSDETKRILPTKKLNTLAIDQAMAMFSPPMTDVELAEKIGVSRNTVYQWRLGVMFPSTRNLRKLCDVLEIAEGDIIEKLGQ
jgi:DNA-binding Xre family transcriptional regulator